MQALSGAQRDRGCHLLAHIFPVNVYPLPLPVCPLYRHLVGPRGVVAAICGTPNVRRIEATGLVSNNLTLDYRK